MKLQLTKIEKAIKKSGLKKEYIASQLGITPTTLSGKLKGRLNYQFRLLELREIARLTKTDLRELL